MAAMPWRQGLGADGLGSRAVPTTAAPSTPTHRRRVHPHRHRAQQAHGLPPHADGGVARERQCDHSQAVSRPQCQPGILVHRVSTQVAVGSSAHRCREGGQTGAQAGEDRPFRCCGCCRCCFQAKWQHTNGEQRSALTLQDLHPNWQCLVALRPQQLAAGGQQCLRVMAQERLCHAQCLARAILGTKE